ncbi:glycerol kinase GlpK [Thiotrichales bacterium 19S11-10]|nr:glycerol kinase GlpK [Thiotrichales bacterium 19S11-10]
MKQYILTLDQGTTSSRAILFDQNSHLVDLSQKEFKQYYPKSAWVEHDPNEIWYTQASVIAEVVSKANIKAKQISAIGIANQRETTILWDRETHEPIYNAIVWQDRRTAKFCDELKKDSKVVQLIQDKTGLVIDAYFSASKIKWILDHVNGARKRAQEGKLLFGTVDSWLMWKLTNGKTHVTDPSNASRTMLYNIHKLAWDEDLLKLFDIPASLLPEVMPSSGIFAETKTTFFSSKVPIAGVAGDQQAALFGQMCLDKGSIKTTYGTGCFLMMNTGNQAQTSKKQLLSTVAWQIGNEITYALEGSVFIGGALIQWLRDGLGMIQSAKETETLALSVKDNADLYIVPALTGLGAPHWDQSARGIIIGLTRGITKAHIIRAALESINYQVCDVVKSMSEDTGLSLSDMRVDGGAVENNFLMQMQADLLGIHVLRPKVLETTALGAAYLAGLAVGYWSSIDQLKSMWQLDSKFSPSMDSALAKHYLSRWHEALERSKNWANN